LIRCMDYLLDAESFAIKDSIILKHGTHISSHADTPQRKTEWHYMMYDGREILPALFKFLLRFETTCFRIGQYTPKQPSKPINSSTLAEEDSISLFLNEYIDDTRFQAGIANSTIHDTLRPKDRLKEELYTPLSPSKIPIININGVTGRIEDLRDVFKSKLTSLRYDHNDIAVIENLDGYPSLQELDLSHNKIWTIKNINCENIESLFLNHNRLAAIRGLGHLSKLKYLCLAHNYIRFIKNLDNLVNIEDLDLGENKIKKIQNLGHLKKLRRLRLNNNRITKVEGLEELIKLEDLDLSNITAHTGIYPDVECNGIRKIEGLDNLTSLRRLNLWGNPITKLEDMGLLKNLEYLNMGTEGTLNIGADSPESLNLVSNKLRLGKATKITKIEGLEGLAKLEHIILQNQNIRRIEGIEGLTALKKLEMMDNPIDDISYLPDYFKRPGCSYASANGLVINLKGTGIDNIGWMSDPKNQKVLRELEKMKIKIELHTPKIQYAEETKPSLLDTLSSQGICDEDAESIAENFEDLVQCDPVGLKSKNIVYSMLLRKEGRRIVKFVTDKEEAETECLVNYWFSRHPVLRRYSVSCDHAKPIKAKVGTVEKYLVIQKQIPIPRMAIDWHDHDSLFSYLGYWMQALADVHNHGTALMDKLGNFRKAQSLNRTKDKNRRTLNRSYDESRISDIMLSGIESGRTFIHSDCRFENRIGHKFIDWGNAGRGNPYLDVARVLVDGRFHLDYEGKAQLIKRYLSSAENGHTFERAMKEYQSLAYLMSSSIGAYLSGTSCSEEEKLTRQVMLEISPRIRKRQYIITQGPIAA
jgi:hypothetical protein